MNGARRLLRDASRCETTTLLILGLALFILSGIAPRDRMTWWLESIPIFLITPVLIATARSFPFTPLAYRLMFLHALLLMTGAHYTYEQVPLGFWLRDWLDFSRNNYDRIVHFAQGIVSAIVFREILLRRSPLFPGRWIFTLVTAACMALSTLCELVEWLSSLAFGEAANAFLGMQGDIWDAQWDTLWALTGALTAQFLLVRGHDQQIYDLALTSNLLIEKYSHTALGLLRWLLIRAGVDLHHPSLRQPPR